MPFFKTLLKSIIPASVLNLKRARAARRVNEPFAGLSTRQIFSEIYRQRYWGKEGPDGFSSGDGSHAAPIVVPYVEAVAAFLASLGKPSVVDLGCGDFNVGRQLRPNAGTYIACDIVPDLIERNKARFADLDVDFRCIDIVTEPLPSGRVMMVRQVLQHLGNAEVAAVVAKLQAFDYAIVTEHVPSVGFVPNVDKPTGPGTRTALGSGLDLTMPPFSLRPAEVRVLCTLDDAGDTRIVTSLYRFAREDGAGRANEAA